MGQRKPDVVSTLLPIIAAAILAYLILVPLGYLFYESITSAEGAFTLRNYVSTLRQPYAVEAIRNTVIMAVGVTAMSIVVGVPLAFGVSRTDMRGKALARTAVIVSVISPPFLISMAYIILLGPNAGYINRLLRVVLNIEAQYGPINIFSLLGLVLLAVPRAVAFVFMQTAPALENMDPSLEESARMSGAGTARTVFRITLPLVRHAIVSGALLGFSATLALYGIPLMLNINVLAISIRGSLLLYKDFDAAAVLSVLVCLMSLASLFFYRSSVRMSRRYQTITGKGFRPGLMRLGWRRHLFTGYAFGYAVLSFLLPYSTITFVSFLKNIGSRITLSSFTLANYAAVFDMRLTREAIFNSFVLALTSAVLVVVIGLLVAYVNLHSKTRGKAVIDYVSALPMGIAGVALGVGLIITNLSLPFSRLGLYATLWILLIAYLARFVPVGVRNCESGLMQVNTELEEASRVCGAGRFCTLRRITIPLVKNAVLYAFILVFIKAFPELSVSIMLKNIGTNVVSAAILDLWDGSGGLPVASALGLVVFGAIVACILVIQALTGRSMLATTTATTREQVTSGLAG